MIRQKNILILIWVVVTLSGRATAQETVTATDTNSCRETLTLGIGPSYGVSRDQGVSPITYQLFALTPYSAFTLDYRQWSWNAELSLSAYIQTKNFHLLQDWSIQGFGVDAMMLTGCEYRLYQHEKWRMKVGFAATGWLNVAYNKSYMNACVGMSGLIAPLVSCKNEWDFWKITLHVTGSTSPVGWWYRPGFAYISNYSSGQTEVETFDDDYHWNATTFPLLKTDVGIDYHFKSGHTLGVTYSWLFVTSRKSGPWKYEAARHHLQLVFRIAL